MSSSDFGVNEAAWQFLELIRRYELLRIGVFVHCVIAINESISHVAVEY
jgi:hypothetical protein